jgi:hypothetical protein
MHDTFALSGVMCCAPSINLMGRIKLQPTADQARALLLAMQVDIR